MADDRKKYTGIVTGREHLDRILVGTAATQAQSASALVEYELRHRPESGQYLRNIGWQDQ